MGYSPGIREESDTTERLHFHFLHCLVLGKNMVALMVKISACHAGDLGSIPVLGKSPGGGYGKLLQYSCLENSHGQKSPAATVHGVADSHM